MTSFFNTIGLSGEQLGSAEAQAKTQEQKVAQFIRENSREWHTPTSVWRELFRESIPLTSVRRAMTNLTDAGELAKSSHATFSGLYGKPQHAWRYSDRTITGTLFD